jgi:tight adherence protein C
MRTAVALALAWFAGVIVMAAPFGRTPTGQRARPPVRRRFIGERRHRRRVDAALVNDLPDVVDLFALAVGAGCNVTLAVAAAAGRAPPSWRGELLHVVEAVEAGARVGDALSGLATALGDPARPLATALASSARYGAPLLPALERIAVDARLARRRRAEEAARRLPVTLLFPLVLCILPAFALLSLAPALAGALRMLRP